MTKIVSVEPGSIAEEGGIMPGDMLLSVNGEEVNDILRFRFLTADIEYTLEIQKPDGSVEVLDIYNEYGEDLGLDFEDPLMTKARRCANNCVFCFIDQLPKGMRETLYFKDDDSRLSFLQGNYVSLTNISDKELSHIIEMRMSPINVSVQVTDPKKRVEMLGNPRARLILEQMRKLADAGILMNCQIVLCKGFNDGALLDKSLSDLAAFFPSVQSISVVPFGMTRFRDGLCQIEPFDKDGCRAVIRQVEGWQTKFSEMTGKKTVYLADEFYLKAELPFPPYEDYDDFPQLENGVGMIRVTENEFLTALPNIQRIRRRKVTIATGTASEALIRFLAGKLDVPSEVVAIRNLFFGDSITVSGLITGQDLIAQLKKRGVGEELLIPSNMLRAGTDVFLDDVTVPDVEQALQTKVIVVYNGADFAYKLADSETAPKEYGRRNGGTYETDHSNSGTSECG